MAKSVEDKALRSAYGKLTREQKERFFPGQIEQAKKIIGSLMWLLGSNCEVDRLFELYLTVAARVQMGFDHERIGTTTKMRFSDLVPGNKTSSVVTCIERIIRNFAYIDRINSPEMKAAVRTFDLQNERTFRENDKRFEDAERIPGFGTNPANPVFAHFSFGSYRYLNLLYTDDNTPLTWNRLGSVGTESSNDILDQYELLLPDGTVYLIVYVNMYARKESVFCPSGLVGDGLKTVPEQASTHTSSPAENTEEASEDEEYNAFLRDYAKDFPTKKNQEPQESSSITANPADDDQSKHDEDISDKSNDANVLIEPEEVLNERTTPVLLGSFPIILEKYAIVKKDGQIYARCPFLSVSHKPIHAVQLDLACYNVWHESVTSVTGFQFGDLRVRRDEHFGGDQLIPLPDATTRSIEVNVSRVAFTDGALLQKSATENTDVPALLSLETYLGSSELCDEYKAQTYDNAEYAPIRLGAFWRCTCGAINSEIEHTCHKCGNSENLLFDHLDISALQASIEKKKRLQREKEERERIEREEARQKAEEEASARRLQEEADAQRRAEKRKRLGKRIAVASAVIVAAALVVYLVVWQAIPAWKYRSAEEIKYKEAESALRNGDFDTAFSIFSSLADYKDSQIQANEAVYQKGIAALNNGEFEIASLMFNGIPDYKDSETMSKEAIYQKAKYLMEAKSYLKAAPLFEAIIDYKDSRELRAYCRKQD